MAPFPELSLLYAVEYDGGGGGAPRGLPVAVRNGCGHGLESATHTHGPLPCAVVVDRGPWATAMMDSMAISVRVAVAVQGVPVRC